MNKTHESKMPLRLIIGLFFLWALTSNLLPILIPHFKKAFNLQYFQASLVDWAYWISYFFFAIPAGLLMKKAGYKTTIITGLVLAALGAFLFPLAADAKSYTFFLTALFIVASGMTFLETAANPYIRSFGTPESYSQRLNFAQAFNGLGAVVATNVLSHLVLSDNLVKTDDEVAAMSMETSRQYFDAIFNSVKLPYMLIGGVLLVFIILFIVTKLPAANKVGTQTGNAFFNPFRHARLTRSMAAQFFYVGAQVCVSSFFINYAKEAGYELKTTKIMLGGILIAFMVGRYVGAFLMKKYNPIRLLMIFALCNVVLSAVIVGVGGLPGIIAFFGVEFFMSIMYPTIFSIGIKNMGEKTEMASSYLVMMIIGGALLPLILGAVSDATDSIKWGYSIPLLCFAIICLFAKKEYSLLTPEEVKNNATT